EGEDSSWYPTMRLFRQQKQGEWAGVFECLADALRQLAAGKVMPEPSRSAEWQSHRGKALAAQGQLLEAVVSFREAARLRPDRAEANYNLGNTLKAVGQLEEAQASCAAAIRLRPDLVEAHNNLGTVLAELGRLEEAQACYRAAVRLRPDIADLHNN